MSNYIEVSNGTNIIINDTYKNVSFYMKYNSWNMGGNFATRLASVQNESYLNSSNTIYTINMSNGTTGGIIRFPIEKDQIASIKCSSPNYNFMPFRLSNTLKISISTLNGANITNLPNYLTIYLFKFNETTKTGGVEVLSENGSQIFNSNLNYMRVIDSVNSISWQSNDVHQYQHSISVVVHDYMKKTNGSVQGITFPSNESWKFYDYVTGAQVSPIYLYGSASLFVINSDNL